eukprot:Tbor_TRINITY_DN5441_c4_g4::TRINITY_DN5441_c4_g4_i3::g.25458::m.25458
MRKGNMPRIQIYIDGKGSLTDSDSERLTFLHHASSGKQTEVVKLILRTAEERNITLGLDNKDSTGWTPLHYAADKGCKEICEALLDEGANINAKDDFKRTALHLAANAGHSDMVEFLLLRGAAKGFQTVVGWTALKYAEEGNHTACVTLLGGTPSI